MIQQSANSLGSVEERLNLKKQIDAVCDSFEQAWNEEHCARMEDFLELVPPENCALLFRELLSLELALRAQHNESWDESAYRQRFADYTQIVTEVTLRHSVQFRTKQVEEYCDGCMGIAQSFRREHADQYNCQNVDQSASDLRSVLVRYHPGAALPQGLPLPIELWLSLFNVCAKSKTLNATAFDSLVSHLLTAFSPLRCSIVISSLLCCSVASAAQAVDVSERTVVSTLHAALHLLSAM